VLSWWGMGGVEVDRSRRFLPEAIECASVLCRYGSSIGHQVATRRFLFHRQILQLLDLIGGRTRARTLDPLIKRLMTISVAVMLHGIFVRALMTY
jgi:hypothetical protein